MLRATTKTLDDVMCELEIPQTDLIKSVHLRDNLLLSVSLSRNRQVWINKIFRMKDLMSFLKSSPFVDIKSIIIYCKFQFETDLISKHLCDNNISAMVVATVAFGMGLDKRDFGAVRIRNLIRHLRRWSCFLAVNQDGVEDFLVVK
ncbi:ATP-dependent DNA helicase Q-like 5 [Rhododendron vialii]|uniref:ATP-dependent DNA helicase Q-like 5 n=1 Tax=Rhododendron vialii TaxID=182163 RepID=UPI00265F28BA|nr:ATP-dependent DNA helicase Q-like 5 [Rhododendron vialii]